MTIKHVALKIIFLCGLFLLSGCDETSIEPIPSGEWYDFFSTNDLYRNELMGIQFQLPNSWRGFTNENLEQNQHFLERGLLSTPNIDPDLISIQGELIVDMIAMNLSARPGSALTASEAGTVQVIAGRLYQNARHHTPIDALQMMFQRSPREADEYTARDLLEIIENDLERSGVAYLFIADEISTIGIHEFYMLETVIEAVNHFPLTRRIYLNLEGDLIRIIVVTSLNSGQIDQLMAYFLAPEMPIFQERGVFERRSEVVDKAELLGTWVWEEDGCSTHDFKSDGTGIQTFCDGYLQSFDWTFIDGALLMNFETPAHTVFTQMWQTNLVDQTLTLTSFYAPDEVIEIYTRGD